MAQSTLINWSFGQNNFTAHIGMTISYILVQFGLNFSILLAGNNNNQNRKIAIRINTRRQPICNLVSFSVCVFSFNVIHNSIQTKVK